jgi:hypothetical protein
MTSPSEQTLAGAEAYATYLGGRWPARSRLVGLYALAGTTAYLVLDLLLRRDGEPGVEAILRARLPGYVDVLFGLWMIQRAPRWRYLPALIVALSVGWCWWNDAAYLWLGQGGSAVQAVALIAACVCFATFVPLRLPGQAAVFGLMAIGHVALDLAWPQARPLSERVGTDAAVIAFVLVELVLFSNLTTSLHRGFALRAELERALRELEASRHVREEELQARVQQALNEVKVLSGLLPICAWCKRVRDDEGYWDKLEAYIAKNSQASFTHSICPRCLDSLDGPDGKRG